jgi:hypothetical protein
MKKVLHTGEASILECQDQRDATQELPTANEGQQEDAQSVSEEHSAKNKKAQDANLLNTKLQEQIQQLEEIVKTLQLQILQI